VKSPALNKKPATESSRSQPMFPPAAMAGRKAAGDFFFAARPAIQRQEESAAETKAEEKDPVVEGLKTTGEQLLKNPRFKSWYEPKVDMLKLRLWEEQPSEAKAAIITYGGINLALAGLVFALNPQVRELLSDVNIGKPLGWIPYSPIEGFKYKLPAAGKSTYGFGADFTLTPYLEKLHERYPQVPLTGATFGLETGYTPGQGLSVTGGKFGLEFLGGGLTAEGKTFTELSPYPMLIPGAGPLEPPSMLMQSVPGLPALQTPGFQVTLSADLYKLFPKFAKLF